MSKLHPIRRLMRPHFWAGLALALQVAAQPALGQDEDQYLYGEDSDESAYDRADPSPAALLTSGQSLACDARAAVSGKRWPCRFRMLRYNPDNGRFIGEVTWTSLDSIHEVRGVLIGNRLTFTETRAIRSGSALLNIGYAMRLGTTVASGSWRDPASRLQGSMIISLPARPVVPAPAPWQARELANGVYRVCHARSADGRRNWPCQVKFTQYNPASGRIGGEVIWTSLNSVHVIEGQLRGNWLTFTETRAIRSGSAVLYVSYDMRLGARAANGSWHSPSTNSRGSMSIDLTP